MPEILGDDEETEEFKEILTLHNWMIRWFMYKKTITEAEVIFMIFLSGVSWNMLRKASIFQRDDVVADDDEKKEAEPQRPKHLEFCFTLNFFCLESLKCFQERWWAEQT